MLGASKAKSTKDTNNFTVFAHYYPGMTMRGYLKNPTTHPLLPTTQLRNSLVFDGTKQDHQTLKKSLTTTGLGLSESERDLLRTERVGFALMPTA